MSKSTQIDYLIVDPDIPNQRFCCISFVEPTDMRIIAKKETFMATHFITQFLEEYETAKEFSSNPDNILTDEIKDKMDLSYNSISKQYKDYRKTSFTDLSNDFDKRHNPKDALTISGVKIRGSYRSLEDAQDRANEMREYEPAVHVFVAQVGYWLPYDPENMEDIKAEFREQALNEIYGKKQEALKKAEKEFGDRKQNLMDTSIKENEEKKKKNAVERQEAMEATETLRIMRENESHNQKKLTLEKDSATVNESSEPIVQPIEDLVIIDTPEEQFLDNSISEISESIIINTETGEEKSLTSSPQFTKEEAEEENTKPKMAQKVGNRRIRNQRRNKKRQRY